MKTTLLNYWASIRTSFWFIPSMMLVAALMLSFILVSLDKYLSLPSLNYHGLFIAVSPDGARTILSTIAGSVMSVTGVTFSITIVVLNLASTQFGPRLIRNFIRDRSIQTVLGIFLASFLYCILILRAVQTTGSEQFVPNISIIFAIILAIIDIGVLIFFIHHIAIAIQADKVVSAISKEMQHTIKRIFPNELDTDTTLSNKKRAKEDMPEEDGTPHYYTHQITAGRSGYMRAINHDRLIQTAEQNDYLIRLQLRPGQFVTDGCLLAEVRSKEIFDVDHEDAITDAIIIGDQRTSEEDAEYSIHQLVEVAVRALSPGINDPYTAVACIDQLGAVMCYLTTRQFPSPYLYDDTGCVRIVTKPLTFSGMLNASFDQIRQYGRTTVSIVVRLLETLTTLAHQSRIAPQRQAIHRQADMILRSSEKSRFEQNDREDVHERYRKLLTVLNEFDDPGESYESYRGSSRD